MANEIRRVGVVGLGTMGAGIAQLCIEAGLETIGHEVEAARGEAARGRIAYFLERKVENKHAVFAELERVCAVDAILATNTSALSVGAIAAGLKHPERVAGMHFF